MTALVSIRCDTEMDDGSFCIGATVSTATTSVARLEASALQRGWTQDGARHYCPTCTAKLPCLYCGESHMGWCPRLPPMEDEQCVCGHDLARHGPEAGGCIRCRCTCVDPDGPTVCNWCRGRG